MARHINRRIGIYHLPGASMKPSRESEVKVWRPSDIYVSEIMMDLFIYFHGKVTELELKKIETAARRGVERAMWHGYSSFETEQFSAGRRHGMKDGMAHRSRFSKMEG